jgi:hypothetical protein
MHILAIQLQIALLKSRIQLFINQNQLFIDLSSQCHSSENYLLITITPSFRLTTKEGDLILGAVAKAPSYRQTIIERNGKRKDENISCRNNVQIYYKITNTIQTITS